MLPGFFTLAGQVRENVGAVIILYSATAAPGILRQAGMVFVTMFASGSLPFSLLLASSIVQDGHGMLPMLAVSRRGFIWVKVINIIVGLIIGLIGYLLT